MVDLNSPRKRAENGVAVLIAAYNSDATIGNAIRSALAEEQVEEVIVIDDASTDRTGEAASEAAAGDDRFRLIKQPFNQGPSAARNRGLASSSSPFVAVLDADDVFLPGRLANIPFEGDWDLCADNIRFTKHAEEMSGFAFDPNPSQRSCLIDFKTFVEGNIGQKGLNRTELGFLKPIIRREFLDRHELRFDERCRLGEDFILYAQMLAKGARFKLIEACGYGALERENSLSSEHSVTHLRALLDASRALASHNGLTREANSALETHAKLVSEKVAHREVLEVRQYDGFFPAIFAMLKRPSSLRDIWSDRFGKQSDLRPPARKLIDPEAFERLSG